VTPPGGASIFAVLLAFPVAMALATGVEAPSSAIAQLGQLDNEGRRRFGQLTLWLTLGVVGTITIGLAVEIARLQIALPSADSTLVAELARIAAPEPVFAAFQLVTALLLLAAASSSFQAGPGLLAALAERSIGNGHDIGILPRALGRTNRARTPYWGVAFFGALAMLIVVVGGGRDQVLVLFYAVAVFISFLAGLAAMARFSKQDGRRGYLVLNVFGAVVVGFTLIANLARGYPLASLAATLLIAGALFWMWVRAGRPRGVRNVAAEAELEAAELEGDDPVAPAAP